MSWIDNFVEAIHNPPEDVCKIMEDEYLQQLAKDIEEDELLDFQWAERVAKQNKK